MQRFADDAGLAVWVRHCPPGSKWNKLAANTTTGKVMSIEAELRAANYPVGVKVGDELAAIRTP